MRKTGLIGNPVEHSLSPFIHNSAYSQLGFTNWVYEVFSVDKKSLEKFVNDTARTLIGFNVTMPCKMEIVPFCDYLDQSAESLGAVNTVVVVDGKLKGFNTDGFGFIEALDFHNIEYQHRIMTILGNGGAAKAVAYAANQNDMEVRILHRPSEEEIREALKDTDILVNATPVGMTDEESPVSGFQNVKDDLFVADLIYHPLKTPLLKMAEQEGFRYMNGLDMLFFQADLSFYIWTGRHIPDPVYGKLLEKIGQIS